MVYNVRIKVFPDGSKQYLYCEKAKEREFKRALIELPDADLDDELVNEVKDRDINNECCKRAKQKIWDIARSNSWDYFFTLTFDPCCVNRYDYSACADLIKKFTKSLAYYNCDWIIVPEQHADGAYHFHGLIRGTPPLDIGKVMKDGSVLYNLRNYRYGFTSCSRIKNEQSVATYLTKYITKDMCVPSGQKRYWFSRGLNHPNFVYAELDSVHLLGLMAKSDFRKKIDSPYGSFWMLEIH